MEAFKNAKEDLLLAASQVRVLADLMLPYTDLQDVDRTAFAHVLQNLAARLERDLEILEARLEGIAAAARGREERA